MKKLLKNWGSLAVALIAVATSVCAICFDNAHFDSALEQDKISAKKAGEQFEMAMKQAEEANEIADEAKENAEKYYADLEERFEEVVKPSKIREGIYNSIFLLSDRLEYYRDWMKDLPYESRVVVEPHYTEARNKFYSAFSELRADNFDQARQLVEDAFISLGKITEAIAK